MTTLPLWAILLLGAAGGIVNAQLTEGHFLLPGMVEPEGLPGRRAIHPGFIGNVIVGIAAGAATYGLGTAQLNQTQQAVFVFVGGIGGASVLANLLHQKTVNLAENRADAADLAAKKLNEVVESLLGGPS